MIIIVPTTIDRRKIIDCRGSELSGDGPDHAVAGVWMQMAATPGAAVDPG